MFFLVMGCLRRVFDALSPTGKSSASTRNWYLYHSFLVNGYWRKHLQGGCPLDREKVYVCCVGLLHPASGVRWCWSLEKLRAYRYSTPKNSISLYVISSWHTVSIMFRHFVSLLCKCFSLLLTLTRLSANLVIEFSEPTSAMETLNLLRTFDFRLLAMRRFPFKESLPCKAYSTLSTPIIITTPKYVNRFCPLQALRRVAEDT